MRSSRGRGADRGGFAAGSSPVEWLDGRALLSSVPTVATGAASSVSLTAATLSATVNPNGSTTTALFQYSNSPTFTPTVATTIVSVFSGPTSVALDAAGDVFVADPGDDVVLEVLPNGTVLTVGSGFSSPTGVAVDAAGDVFVADLGRNAVYEVLPNGTINTIGSGFNGPQGVAVNAAGDVFVADTGNSAVKEVLPDGTINTISSGSISPPGVAVDAAGDVFVADNENDLVYEVLPNGTTNTIATGFGNPVGVAVDAAGDVFVADKLNQSVVELSPPTISGPNSGTLNAFTFAGIANLTGGTATDTFTVGTDGSLTGTLSGGGGADILIGPNVASTFTLSGSNEGNLLDADSVPTTPSATPRQHGSGAEPFRPIPNSPTTARPSIATMPPAPRRWPVVGRARTIHRRTTPPWSSCAARPSIGSRPNTPPGQSSSTPARRMPGRSCRRPSSTGRKTPTSQAFATMPRYPSCPKKNAPRTNSSGATSIGC